MRRKILTTKTLAIVKTSPHLESQLRRQLKSNPDQKEQIEKLLMELRNETVRS